ncbi:MAG: hypothetical protein M3309_13350 [Actinomycetota bacterium]|nr:hypothetical protein [Actinomycetota bacterium]
MQRGLAPVLGCPPAPGFRSTKRPAELRFRTLLTDGAHEEVRFERVAVSST